MPYLETKDLVEASHRPSLVAEAGWNSVASVRLEPAVGFVWNERSSRIQGFWADQLKREVSNFSKTWPIELLQPTRNIVQECQVRRLDEDIKKLVG